MTVSDSRVLESFGMQHKKIIIMRHDDSPFVICKLKLFTIRGIE